MRRPKKVGSTLPQRDVKVIFSRRAALLSFAGAGVMGAITFRLAQLQATDALSREYTNAADDNRFDTRIVPPPRGVIYDRFGVVLAQTSKDYQVSVVQNDTENLEESVSRVAQILNLGPEWVRRTVLKVRGGSKYEPQPVKEGLTWEEFNAINVRMPELRGVTANSADVRAYPFDVVYGHPIGYVQKPTQHDIDLALADPDEGESKAMYLRNPHVRVGKAGLEASMEEALHGVAGWRKVIVNARGVEMGEDEHERKEPVKGSGVVLTIDHELQRVAMQSFGDQAGGVVVMDILTGDILVMASAPGFDPNLFVNGIDTATFNALNTDEKKPLFNKAASGTYPPGSTFKTMVGIAAKQAGVADDWHVNCPGFFPFGGRDFHCWKRGGHGPTDLHKAIRESCDVYFYNAALRAGPERIAGVAREFGLGVAHDVTLPNVATGLVPDPAWWLAHRHEQWTAGLTVNYGIGQGSLQVSPLQLCTQVARIANNGKAVVPRLVREAPGVTQPTAPPTMTGIAPEHLAAIRQGMFGVCNEPGGTATRVGGLINLVRRPDGVIVDKGQAVPGSAPIQVAGKTGTSQVRIITAAERARGVTSNDQLPWPLRDNALFISFGPWDNPRYACAVIIEHGGHTNAAFDAPVIASRVLRETFLRDPANRQPARLASLEPTTERQA
jgi:penicillin-binding protein 2